MVYGEALLTLEPASRKRSIAAEAARILRPGGRYGVHELLLKPDSLPERDKAEIERVLSRVLRVGARPLVPHEWQHLLEVAGFAVHAVETGQLLLLDPKTFADEVLGGSAAFLGARSPTPRYCPRLARIWRTFRRYRDHLGAVTLVADNTT